MRAFCSICGAMVERITGDVGWCDYCHTWRHVDWVNPANGALLAVALLLAVAAILGGIIWTGIKLIGG